MQLSFGKSCCASVRVRVCDEPLSFRDLYCGTVRVDIRELALDVSHNISFGIGEVAPDVVPYIFSRLPR